MGSKTQTTTAQQSTTPANLAGLQSIFGQVQNAAQTPYTAYSGELTAPVNQQQQAGIAGVNAGANAAQPFYTQAGQYATQAGSPISADAIQHYQNPFTQNVIDATKANFAEDNGQAQNALKAKAAMVGALGGSGQGVASAELARQQQLAQAPTIANLYSQGYGQALQAAQADRSAAGNAAGTFGNLGTGAQAAALQGAGAQINAGTLQQQTQQQGDQAQYQQYLQRQAFPYQNAQFFSQYGTPAALAQGTSTSGTQVAPGPSIFAQLAGLGIAGAGVASKFAADGGRIEFADGGSPFNFMDVHGYVPVGGNAPQVSLPQTQLKFGDAQKPDMTPITAALSGIGKGTFRNPFGASASGGWGATDTGAEGVGSLGGLYSHGGLVDAIHSIHRAIKHSRGGSVIGSPFQAFADGGGVRPPGGVVPTLEITPQIAARMQRRLQNAADDKATQRVINDAAKYGVDWSHYGRHDGGRVAYADGGSPFASRFDAVNDAPDIVPEQPYRLAGPAAMEAWRKGVDAPNPAVTADSESPMTAAPAPATGPANPMRVALPPEITGSPQDDSEPGSALAFDKAAPNAGPLQLAPEASAEPAQAKSPFGISPKGSDALIATGLGIMASRSPFALSALGEGGLHGLKNYSDATAAEREAADKKITQAQNQKRIDFEAQRIAQSASQFAKTNSLAERRQKFAEDKTPEGYREKKGGGYEPIPGGPADPEMLRKVAEAKRAPGQIMDDETAEFLADRVVAGDTRALVGLGRGAQGAENIAKIQSLAVRKAKEQGVDAKGILRNIAEQAYNVSGARALGTKTIHFGTAEKAMEESLPIARAASADVPRTQWKGLTELIQKGQTQINDPKLKKLLIATDTAAKDYARTINPSGTLRESDIAYARKILSTADSEEAYNAALDQLQVEAGVMKRALERQKTEMLGGKSEPHSAPPLSKAGSYEETKEIGGKKYGRIGKDWFAL